VVWGKAYTELFFLDEVTAFAAGHRPCFECRRKDAELFANFWALGHKRQGRAHAAEIDKILHRERMFERLKRKHQILIDDLPDAAVVELDGDAWAVRGKILLQWTPSGYHQRRPLPASLMVNVLTPPSILKVLARGYPPQWHPSAGLQ
jgi:hypothetical protein